MPVYRPKFGSLPDFAAGFTSNTVNAGWQARRISDWSIVMAARGRGEILTASGKIRLAPDRLVLFRPGLPRYFHTATGWALLWFHFMPHPEVIAALHWSPAGTGTYVYQFRDARESRRVFSQLHTVYHLADTAADADRLLAVNRLEYLMLRLRSDHRSDGSASLSQGIIRALKLLADEEHLNESMEMIAATCGLSRAAFYRRFKAETGLSPREYRERLLMRRARTLLAETRFPIEKISQLLGMHNAFYFSRRFKKAYGIPPKDFRSRAGQTGSNRI